MNGAQALVHTLIGGGIEACFTNPGTSEMHFVAALDEIRGMRCVLGLFEGVVTGAADGYARMTGKPAATLLHLGPGLANGLANLHNASRARSPVVNIVGDHATYHHRYDAPLTRNIEAVARPFSDWVRTSPDAASIARDGADAIAAARRPPGGIATLILPADTAWTQAPGGAAAVSEVAPRERASEAAVSEAAALLRAGRRVTLFLGGQALRAPALAAAGRIREATGARLVTETLVGRMERGAGRVEVERLPYPIDPSLTMLRETTHLIAVGTKPPVAFFAYPDKPSLIAPESAVMHCLASEAQDVEDALERLAHAVGASAAPAPVAPRVVPGRPSGPIDVETIGAILARCMPEHAIVVDESISAGRSFFADTQRAAPHDWLQVTGGSIGIGIPLATGAAVASPGRKVVTLEGDGSAMYTLQGLWTQAREQLDVVTVILANRSYAILRHELTNVGVLAPGRTALDMLDIGNPDLDWVGLARAMGVPGGRATTSDEFFIELGRGLASEGPYLVELVLP